MFHHFTARKDPPAAAASAATASTSNETSPPTRPSATTEKTTRSGDEASFSIVDRKLTYDNVQETTTTVPAVVNNNHGDGSKPLNPFGSRVPVVSDDRGQDEPVIFVSEPCQGFSAANLHAKKDGDEDDLSMKATDLSESILGELPHLEEDTKMPAKKMIKSSSRIRVSTVTDGEDNDDDDDDEDDLSLVSMDEKPKAAPKKENVITDTKTELDKVLDALRRIDDGLDKSKLSDLMNSPHFGLHGTPGAGQPEPGTVAPKQEQEETIDWQMPNMMPRGLEGTPSAGQPEPGTVAPEQETPDLHSQTNWQKVNRVLSAKPIMSFILFILVAGGIAGLSYYYDNVSTKMPAPIVEDIASNVFETAKTIPQEPWMSSVLPSSTPTPQLAIVTAQEEPKEEVTPSSWTFNWLNGKKSQTEATTEAETEVEVEDPINPNKTSSIFASSREESIEDTIEPEPSTKESKSGSFFTIKNVSLVLLCLGIIGHLSESPEEREIAAFLKESKNKDFVRFYTLFAKTWPRVLKRSGYRCLTGGSKHPCMMFINGNYEKLTLGDLRRVLSEGFHYRAPSRSPKEELVKTLVWKYKELLETFNKKELQLLLKAKGQNVGLKVSKAEMIHSAMDAGI